MLVAGLALGAVLVRWLSPADPKPLVQLALQRPDSTPIGSQAPVGDIAISRDGRRVAYVTGSQGVTTLAIRALDKLDPLTIADARGPIGPFLSPDGNWIGFFETATTQLKRVPVSGGAPQLICAYTGSPRGASWGEDNRIVFATSSTAAGLLRVAAAGGTPETLTTLDVSKGETGHWFPDVLPGGTGILFSVKQSGVTDGSVAVFDTAAGTRRTLLPGGFARYVKSGHLVYAGASTLQAVAFDIRTLQIQSDPVPVVDHVVTKSSGTASFDIADDGTLAYLSGEAASALRTPVWMDRDRKEEAIKAPVRAYVYPRISPDGRRVAFDIRDQDNDIWTLDLATGSLARLTIDPGLNRGVAWTPDGARIAFSAVRDGKEHVFWQAADGSGAPERLTESSGVHVPSAFTPDGKYLIFQQPGAVPFDLSMVDVTQPARQRHVTPLLNAPHNEGNGEVSPDGKWIAYESNESGQRTEIFVRPFPNVNSARWQVSNNGGSRPVWLPKTGAELFYLQAAAQGQERGIMSVRIVPGPTFSYGTPRMAITDPPGFAQFQGRVYDVSPDGKKFLFLKVAAAASDPAQLIVVLNWVDELKKLVPGR
jgi:Tol biopolymer transport system component